MSIQHYCYFRLLAPTSTLMMKLQTILVSWECWRSLGVEVLQTSFIDGKYSTSSATGSERYTGGGASQPANGATAQPRLKKQSSVDPRPHAVGASDPIPIKGKSMFMNAEFHMGRKEFNPPPPLKSHTKLCVQVGGASVETH